VDHRDEDRPRQKRLVADDYGGISAVRQSENPAVKQMKIRSRLCEWPTVH
jgi:hypothetical protein